ncbi:MAG: glutamate--tRNA ligase family protein, partial [Gemmatimonadales bacterium]
MTPRVRFAPSPTGYLHVGGARTALFNWLFARKTDGTFLLRIEDTDKERSSDEHTQVILDGLTWLGLDWDEDPVFQGANLPQHQAAAERLKSGGHLYEEDGAFRLRMPPDEIAWDDAVYGRISFQGKDIKDWVILRSDGTPTYNFAVVCDDIAMRVTHVMRGEDHISNTPKQIAVYRALGAALPTFAHVPMIHGPDGKKLSKRHGATAVGDYQNLGILPGAMRNFLALLGWSPGGDRELFFDIQEMIDAFALDHVATKAAIFDLTKLEWMNGQHLSRMPAEALAPIVGPMLAGLGVTAPAGRVRDCIEAVKERSRTTIHVAEQVAVRLDRSRVVLDDKARKFIEKDPQGYKTALATAGAHLSGLAGDRWTAAALEAELRALAEGLGVGAGK